MRVYLMEGQGETKILAIETKKQNENKKQE